MTTRTLLICAVVLFAAAAFTITSYAQDTGQSHVGAVLAKLAGGTWHFQGASRHGENSRQESSYERGPGEISFTGRGSVWVNSELASESAALYTYHPRRGRWIYTSVSSDGAVQEAEELESGDNYFVFKGTSYRPDGGQTTFVWRVTLLDDNRFRSESMAFHEGSWRENPPGEFAREQSR